MKARPSFTRSPLAALLLRTAIAPASGLGAGAVLPGTDPLNIERPLDEVMVEGLNRFCRRELAASREQRATRWKRGFSSDRADAASILPQRERFRALIGAVDARWTADVSGRQRFELVSTLDQSSVVARSSRVTVHAVRWPVFEGVTAEGLLLVPAAPRAGVAALPDADWTPETFCGLSGQLPESVQFVRRLAEASCLVAIPMLISRSDEFSGSPHVAYTNQPHREFVYRQAFEAGRHIIGYEVQKVLAAVDLLEQHAKRQRAEAAREPIPIGVAGVGEGGLLALYSAAIDRKPEAWKPVSMQHAGPQTALRDAAAREKRQLNELQTHVQSLLRRSHQVRDAKWRLNPTSIEQWERSRPRLRDWVHDELIGRLAAKRLAPHPRSRRVLETDEYVGYEIVLDVVEDVIASGILLLPKNLAAGEQRPLIVCQHGLEGTPMDTITRDPRSFRIYKAFSAELEFFDGPHTIHGQGTFHFLHRHLQWPKQQPAVQHDVSR